MATATFIVTPDVPSSDDQGFAASQDESLLVTPDIPATAHVSPGYAYKMRAWDTVAGSYLYWTSLGDVNTRAPTLNPVINTTAVQMSRPRTV